MDLINFLNSIGININLENLDENLINDIAILFSNLKKENKENEFFNKNFNIIENNNNNNFKKEENLEKSITNGNSFEEIMSSKEKKELDNKDKGIHLFYFNLFIILIN